jgi:hypothetical protein
MNIVDLRDQMTRKAIEWEEELEGKGVGQDIGIMVRAWVSMIERLTTKLVNPRKDQEAITKQIVSYGDKILEEMENNKNKQNRIHPDEDPNTRRNY